jgi:hypothetical protein
MALKRVTVRGIINDLKNLTDEEKEQFNQQCDTRMERFINIPFPKEYAKEVLELLEDPAWSELTEDVIWEGLNAVYHSGELSEAEFEAAVMEFIRAPFSYRLYLGSYGEHYLVREERDTHC